MAGWNRVSFFARAEKQRDGKEQERHEEYPCGNRVGNENGGIALADGEGAARLGFGERAENQADHGGRDRNIPTAHDESEQTEYIKNNKIDNGLMQAISAKSRENQDPAVKQRPRYRQNLHPDTDERQVEDQQQHVADIQAREQTPHQIALRLKEQRPGLDAVVLKRA